ncbi:MAG: SH3 domain-containing protein [Lachnospiraceae bacterium]|nr:SH3 domain-containing protein [Lachnospiraceae bacterium]
MGRKRRKNQPNQTNDIQTTDAAGLDEGLTEEAEGVTETPVEEEVPAEAESPTEEYFAETEQSAEEYATQEEFPTEAYYEDVSEEELHTEAEPFADEEILNDEELRELVEADLARNAAEDTEDTEKTVLPSHDESLGSFIGEMLVNLRVWVGKNRSFCIFTVLALVVCIAVIIIAGRLNRGTPAGTGVVSANVITGETPVVTDAIPLPPDPLAEDAVPEINDLINRYFDAMESGDLDTFLSIRSYTDSVEKAKFEAKCEYIEAYQNIHCYTKPGPYEASYMVYVTYDLKLKDWEKPAPALVTLVVCTDQENHLYIYSGGFDENIVDYIRGVTSQEDVYDLITKVQTEYQEIMDTDADFSEYMSVLNQLIKDGVGVRLAAAAEAGIQPEDSVSVSDQTVAETPADVSGNTAEENVSGNAASEDTSFQVRTTATVNVRMSDSENADKMGKAENGMELTCLEQMQNGWSKVLYDGKTGYIKTEYLVAVGTQTETGEQNTVVGKVMVMSSVNIRGSADMEGNVLGKAYPGTSFDVIAKDWNGWTTILYNGKTAYIRTEYVEFKAN